MTKTGRKMQERLPEQVLTELASIGLTRATDVLTMENGAVELKNPAKIGKKHGAAIASVEKTSSGWKLKFYDKLKALELLGTYLGMFGSAAGNREEGKTNLLEAILSSTQEVMDTSDIQELQQAADAGNDLVEPAEIPGL